MQPALLRQALVDPSISAASVLDRADDARTDLAGAPDMGATATLEIDGVGENTDARQADRASPIDGLTGGVLTRYGRAASSWSAIHSAPTG